MAVGLTVLRDAVASQLSDELDGVRCYGRLSGQMQLPACVVLPAEPYVDRDQSMQRGHVRVRLDVAIVVRTANLEQAQKSLDSLIDDVTDALLSDRTLDGVCLDLHVPTVSAPEDGELSGTQVLTSVVELSLLVGDA